MFVCLEIGSYVKEFLKLVCKDRFCKDNIELLVKLELDDVLLRKRFLGNGFNIFIC